MTEDWNSRLRSGDDVASSSSSIVSQTRFNFYNAEEFREKHRPQTPLSPPDEKKTNRFNFYDSSDINEQARGLVEPISSREIRIDSNMTGQSERTAATADRDTPSLSPGCSTNREMPPVKNTTTNTKFDNSVLNGPGPTTPPRDSDCDSVGIDDQDEREAGGSLATSAEILKSLMETELERSHRLEQATTPQHDNIKRPFKLFAVPGENQFSPEPHPQQGQSQRPSTLAGVVMTSVEASPGGSSSVENPYEDAIKDALMLLRQQQVSDTRPSRPSQNNTHTGIADRYSDDPIQVRNHLTPDRVLQTRWQDDDNGTHAREAERVARQERIAKYASRLMEHQKRGTGSVQNPLIGQSPVPVVHTEDVKRIVRLPAQSDMPLLPHPPLRQRSPMSGDHSTGKSSVSSMGRDEEVNRGVERVLLAILNRAHSKSRGTQDVSSAPDGLLQAVDSLLRPCSSFETASCAKVGDRDNAAPSRRISQERDEEDGADLSSIETNESVRRRSTAEGEENVQGGDAVPDTRTTSQKEIETVEGAAIPIGVFTEPGDTSRSRSDGEFVDGADLDHSSQSSSGEEDSLQIDDGYQEETEAGDDDSFQETVNTLNNVLGPLSAEAGGTTRVVLEPSDSFSSASSDHVVEDNATIPKSPSMFESLTAAVKDAESFVSYVASAMSIDDKSYGGVKDKYSTQDGEDASILQLNEAITHDKESHALMRSICGHLLPYGVDDDGEEVILQWNEEDPNETGYRIVRLTKAQLRRVEVEFERMVNRLKQKSERLLIGSHDGTPDWNGISGTGFDVTGFQRDLAEAEDLLDQEEKRLDAAQDDRLGVDGVDRKGAGSESDEESPESAADSESSSENCRQKGSQSSASVEDGTVQNSHPDFPGVRRTGEGEMGDLEYFHLPVIYKSQVTGFEPTKDLFLEAGNIIAGQYLVENELGSAAFSTAYRCIDLGSDTKGDGDYHDEVCLKVIKNTKDFFDQSLDEIKILELLRQTGKCQQHHILEMKAFFYHREHLIIVTELLRQNLFEFGKFIIDNEEEPYFTERRLCYITRQVLVALDFIHGMSLVHSDVKPENILLSSYSRVQVKLIDFGSSCYLTDRQSSYIQSRSYRAPEVILGLPYDGKIDVWSLGCVVAEMYTGEVTFQNDSIVSMLSRIEAICGPFPRHMIVHGRQSRRFFTECGLLFEHPESGLEEQSPDQNQSANDTILDVFQPKRTSMLKRLGFVDPEVMTAEEVLFVDFCEKLLSVDPDARPTAAEALQHPWIISGEALSELDIKYPSS